MAISTAISFEFTDVLGRLRDNMDEVEITQLLPYQYKKNPGNNLGIFLSITGRPKLNGYVPTSEAITLIIILVVKLVEIRRGC